MGNPKYIYWGIVMILVRVVAFLVVVYAMYHIVRFVMDGADDYFAPHEDVDNNLPHDKHKPNGG